MQQRNEMEEDGEGEEEGENEEEEESPAQGERCALSSWQEMQSERSWMVEKLRGADRNITQVYVHVTASQ